MERLNFASIMRIISLYAHYPFGQDRLLESLYQAHDPISESDIATFDSPQVRKYLHRAKALPKKLAEYYRKGIKELAYDINENIMQYRLDPIWQHANDAIFSPKMTIALRKRQMSSTVSMTPTIWKVSPSFWQGSLYLA